METRKKKLLVISAAASVLAFGLAAIATGETALQPAGAEPGAKPAIVTGNGDHQLGTLGEARQYAHAYADKLDKMSPQEWDAIAKRHRARMEEWKKLAAEKARTSPEVRRHHRQPNIQ